MLLSCCKLIVNSYKVLHLASACSRSQALWRHSQVCTASRCKTCTDPHRSALTRLSELALGRWIKDDKSSGDIEAQNHHTDSKDWWIWLMLTYFDLISFDDCPELSMLSFSPLFQYATKARRFACNGKWSDGSSSLGKGPLTSSFCGSFSPKREGSWR
jgi:hypothetical protein